MNEYRLLKRSSVVEVRSECRDVYTIKTTYPVKPQPGQFFMVWVPGVDEFPLSVSNVAPHVEFTVRVIGEGTRELVRTAENGEIWLRGPYGHGFSLPTKEDVVIGGGVGLAPLKPLMKYAGMTIAGARTHDEIPFLDYMKSIGAHISTDDGSYGYSGTTVDLFLEKIGGKKPGKVYACGPEPMLKALFSHTERLGIPVEFSLERYMKCGVGLCGSCAVGGGYLVCWDGPVFTTEMLRESGVFR